MRICNYSLLLSAGLYKTCRLNARSNREAIARFALIFVFFCSAFAAHAATWYVRSDGGTRFSTNMPHGQCNGLANAPYPGSGENQPCAFKDVRYLWADGSYATGKVFPAWGWVGTGGDTYIIDCPNECRIGYNGPNATDHYLAVAGLPGSSGAPVPPAGTALAHTRVLGKNWANCQDPSAKAHLFGGYATGTVFLAKGNNYVDYACFDITDHSACGRATLNTPCHTSYPLDDYANAAIVTNNQTTNTTFTDINIHGMAAEGMLGPTGHGVVLTRVNIVGNPLSGWNMDAGDGTTGTGTLTLNNVKILWNGCSEIYPIPDPATGITLPYHECTDDNSGGYGDGIGTATVTSNPAWIVNVNHSVAAYNTQDGFDLLHLQGNGSKLTVTNSMAYSNMGQQLKVGAASTTRNNLLVGSCNALREPIPGTPAGYNRRLSDFCRAADTMVALAVHDSAPTYFQNNTMYSANSTGVEIDCGKCTSLATIHYENNVFVGFKNNVDDGYPRGGTGNFANPIYNSIKGLFTNPGSVFSNNATFHPKSNWACPKTSFDETHALCEDPLLTDETWHLYGYGNMSPTANSPLIRVGMEIAGLTTDYAGVTRPIAPTIGALEPGSDPPSAQTDPTPSPQQTDPSPQPQVLPVEVSPNPATTNEALSLSTTVKSNAAPGVAPGGAVMFLDGHKFLGVIYLNSAGEAVMNLRGLPAGHHVITAIYSGDGKNAPWGSGLTEVQVNSATKASK